MLGLPGDAGLRAKHAESLKKKGDVPVMFGWVDGDN